MNILTLLVNSNPWIETIQLLPVLIELGFFCLYLLWIVFVAFLKINVIFISDTTENEGPVFDDVVV